MNSESMSEIKEEASEPPIFTEEELQRMRAAGMDKPAQITWSQWLSPKKLNSRHHIVCYLAASGMKNVDIARHTGLSRSRVQTLIQNPKFRTEIQYLQRQMFAADPQNQFNRLIGDAIATTEEVMKNVGEKGATRLAAANMVIERGMGKVKQEIDLGGNLIRSLFEKMDQKQKNNDAIDVSPDRLLLPGTTSEDNEEDEEVESVSPKPASEVDSWIKENLEE